MRSVMDNNRSAPRVNLDVNDNSCAFLEAVVSICEDKRGVDAMLYRQLVHGELRGGSSPPPSHRQAAREMIPYTEPD